MTSNNDTRRTISTMGLLLILPLALGCSSGGGEGESTAQSRADIGGNLITNGGFESGFTGWTLSGSYVQSTLAHSGSYSLRIGESYPAPSKGSASQSVTVPASGTTTLSFWLMDQCSGATPLNFGSTSTQVLVEVGGFTEFAYENCIETSTWQQTTVDLTPYAGQTVTLVFIQYAIGRGNGSGFYLDDVVVSNN